MADIELADKLDSLLYSPRSGPALRKPKGWPCHRATTRQTKHIDERVRERAILKVKPSWRPSGFSPLAQGPHVLDLSRC